MPSGCRATKAGGRHSPLTASKWPGCGALRTCCSCRRTRWPLTCPDGVMIGGAPSCHRAARSRRASGGRDRAGSGCCMSARRRRRCTTCRPCSTRSSGPRTSSWCCAARRSRTASKGTRWLPAPNVTVVHESAGQLADASHAACDVACIVYGPDPYRSLAMPVKLFESLGHGRPLLATNHDLAGRFVAAHGLGWAVDPGAVGDTLQQLVRNPAEVRRAHDAVMAVRHQHTWSACGATGARHPRVDRTDRTNVRIVTVVGARPQFIKAAVVSRGPARRVGVEELLVHTGQHYDVSMSDVVLRRARASRRRPTTSDVGSGRHGQQTGARCSERVEDVLLDGAPRRGAASTAIPTRLSPEPSPPSS